jgi:amidohydrolase
MVRASGVRCAAYTVLCVLAALAVPADAEELMDQIIDIAKQLEPELIEARRWFHAHPELSNREHKTSAEIARRLTAMGYEPTTGVAGTGVIAVLEGGEPGPVVGWRSDIDALPIEEELDLRYRSQNAGVMHACGHDLHLTVGLGVAEVLIRLRRQVHGTVKLVFQPAEEGPPAGEEGGAPMMIQEGVLEDPAPAAIFGLHVMPMFEAGTIGLRAHGIMAAADRFRITVHGRLTHGSTPHLGVDAVYVGARIVDALQSIPSREIDARSSLVVTVGTFNGGNRWNIVADRAELTGTVRTLDDETWSAMPETIERVVAGVCQAYRATYELEYDRIAPVVSNDEGLTEFAAASFARSLGEDRVLRVEPIMAAEDFAFYLQHIPGAYVFLGVGNAAEGWTDYVHTPTFRPDESAIVSGVVAAATLLTDFTARDPLASRE